MVAWSLSSFRQISSTDFCTPYRKKYHTPLAQDNVLEFFIAGATLVDDVGPWVPDTMVFACDDRVSGGPMGRYARLALAEREEIVLLRRGGGELRRDGRSGGRGQSDRQRGDGRRLVRRWLGAVPSCIGRPAWPRVPKGFLRAARGPRRRARGGACAASCRAGASVARADRGRDRGRTAGTDGLCVRYPPGDQRAAA